MYRSVEFNVLVQRAVGEEEGIGLLIELTNEGERGAAKQALLELEVVGVEVSAAH